MIKTNVRLLLWKHNPNKQGLFPIYLGTTIKGKTSYKSTGKFVKPQHWDEKNEMIRPAHPLAGVWNQELMQLKIDQSSKILNLQINNKGQTLTAKSVNNNVVSNSKKLFVFVEAWLKSVESKRTKGSMKKYRSAINLMRRYGGESVTFDEITTDWLNGFEQHLRTTCNNNTISTRMKILKTFFNAAIKSKVTTNYPFRDGYEMVQYHSEGKEYLSVEELQQLEDHLETCTNSIQRQSIIYFLLGCYTGLRISDWYQFNPLKHVINDSVRLMATKNKEWVYIPISTPMRRVLEYIKQTPLTTSDILINRNLKNICEILGINKHISTHCGRRTFAVTMCAERGISSETCAEMMGITVKVCVESYYKVTQNKITKETSLAWGDLE